jgi:hypothetical protein
MPPAHSHPGNEEAYFVLEGTVEFHVEDKVFEAEDGTFVLVHAGEAHTFGNTSSTAISRTYSSCGHRLSHPTAMRSSLSCEGTGWSPPDGSSVAELGVCNTFPRRPRPDS